MIKEFNTEEEDSDKTLIMSDDPKYLRNQVIVIVIILIITIITLSF